MPRPFSAIRVSLQVVLAIAGSDSIVALREPFVRPRSKQLE